MSKAVMISIQPKWAELIASGIKTVEVRKTRPSIETPFKCYIYCTKAKDKLLTVLKDGYENYGEIYHGKPIFIKTTGDISSCLWHRYQKVIGEFTCDFIDDYIFDTRFTDTYKIPKEACISDSDAVIYGKGKILYGWHISDLQIYDKPIDLSEFQRCCNHNEDCGTCKRWDKRKFDCIAGITRPPQSWCYVEELEKE